MNQPDFENWSAERWQEEVNHAYPVARLESIKTEHPAAELLRHEEDLTAEDWELMDLATAIWEEGRRRGFEPAPQIRAEVEAQMQQYARALDTMQDAYARWLRAGRPTPPE